MKVPLHLRLPFSAENPETWPWLVSRVIRVTFPGGFRPPVELDEVEQECLSRIEKIIANYAGRNGACLESFVRGAVKNDALDYMRRINRESSFGSLVEAFHRKGSPVPAKFIDGNGRRTSAMPIPWEATSWVASSPSDSIPEEQMERVKGILTAGQYEVYLRRFIFGMTQVQTAVDLKTTREAIASRERKLVVNLRKSGLPVPNRNA